MKPYCSIKLGMILPAIAFWLTGCSQNHFHDTYYHYEMPRQLSDGIAVDGIDRAGIDSNRIASLSRLILADSFPNIHSLLIARNDKLVYENYFPGEDENWGFHLGYAVHQANTLHDVRSISKSIVSACIGIALMQKKIKNIDDPIFDYLPRYLQYKTEFNSHITIRHLLTMSSGIRWNEDNPHQESMNSETQMEKSSDPVAYTLALPQMEKPGMRWQYNSGGVQVLAAIIKQVSGDDIDQFADRYLFTPLGIKSFQWIKSQPDFPAAASGLRLSSRDLLKIGLLYNTERKTNPSLPVDWM
jgi:CubicO group peptidase (beta-lactamase class C family)